MRLTRTGQVTIPPSALEQAGILPGADIQVQVEDDTIVIRRSDSDPRTADFLRRLDQALREFPSNTHPSARTLEEVRDLSRGEQFVRLLADAGAGRMTTDEIMELTRGPYDDVDPR